MKLRERAKRIGPLYQLVGVARLLAFRARLAMASLIHAIHREEDIPSPMLRYRVHGALDPESYIEVGRAVATEVARHLVAQGVAPQGAAILDFACGPGRIARELKRLWPGCDLHGSDIDDRAIAWASRHLSRIGTFSTNAAHPPTRHAQASFDAIYSISLFTHLDEPAQDAWLAELARILKPGGVLLATTHGRFALASCGEEELRVLGERGILFRRGRTGRLKLDGLPDSYQTTFHTREYIARTWGRHFDILAQLEGELGRHQDLIVARKRHPQRSRGAG